MPVFGIICLLAGIAIFIFTNMHAPEKALTDVPWVYKTEYYYLFIATSMAFVLYGLYEISAEMLRQGEKNPPTASPQDTKKCPRCAEDIRYEAKICRYCHHEFSDAEISQALEARDTLVAQRSRRFNLVAVIAAGLTGAMLLAGGFYAWQVRRPAPPPPGQPVGKAAAPTVDKTKATPLPTEKSPALPEAKSPPTPKPAAPPAPESFRPFQVGREWAIDWQSKYHYRGILQIKKQLAPNQYLSRLAVTYVTKRKNRKTVFMDGLLTIRGQGVVINCRNPSVSWWDTDDFYLQWEHNTMTGYNVDQKGRRGRAVFTLVEAVGTP
jgi:hypothetical protein